VKQRRGVCPAAARAACGTIKINEKQN